MSYHRLSWHKLLLPLGVAAAVLTSCSPGGEEAIARTTETTTAALEPKTVTVFAEEYFFVAPDTVEAGMTTFNLRNRGKDLHHVELVRLENGHTLEELLTELAKHAEVLPAWASWVGGPNSPVPGGIAVGTLELEPGSYALLCLIPTAQGVPHVMKGMSRALTVVPARGPTAQAPKADLAINLDDYEFGLTQPITAGKRTIEVRNNATQPHEIFIMHLAPGKKAEDLLAWLATQEGPPPGMPVGGTTFIRSGGVNYMTIDFAPGEYGFFCFVPDAKDGKPHFAHGMIEQITVN